MLNKVMLIGNLGADPDIRYTPSGTAVATLSLATSRKWKDKDGNPQEETEWHRVIVWAKSAEYCGNYLHKGNKVYIEGRLQTRKWQDKDNNDRYTTEVISSTVQNLTPRPAGEGGYQEQPPIPQEQYGMGGGMGDGIGGGMDTGEDVPF